MITIKEASGLLGVTPKTIRLWEKEGKITAHRTEGGHRRFEVADLIGNKKIVQELKQVAKDLSFLSIFKDVFLLRKEEREAGFGYTHL